MASALPTDCRLGPVSNTVDGSAHNERVTLRAGATTHLGSREFNQLGPRLLEWERIFGSRKIKRMAHALEITKGAARSYTVPVGDTAAELSQHGPVPRTPAALTERNASTRGQGEGKGRV